MTQAKFLDAPCVSNLIRDNTSINPTLLSTCSRSPEVYTGLAAAGHIILWIFFGVAIIFMLIMICFGPCHILEIHKMLNSLPAYETHAAVEELYQQASGKSKKERDRERALGESYKSISYTENPETKERRIVIVEDMERAPKPHKDCKKILGIKKEGRAVKENLEEVNGGRVEGCKELCCVDARAERSIIGRSGNGDIGERQGFSTDPEPVLNVPDSHSVNAVPPLYTKGQWREYV